MERLLNILEAFSFVPSLSRHTNRVSPHAVRRSFGKILEDSVRLFPLTVPLPYALVPVHSHDEILRFIDGVLQWTRCPHISKTQ